MNVTGIVKQVGATQKLTDAFSKRELILKTEVETEYPQYLVIQFVNKNTSKLDNIHPGEQVTVGINLRGRESNKDGVTKYYSTIEGWKVNKQD